MRKLVVFNHVSLDGYFVDMNGDMSWAKADHQDAEWNAFVTDNARMNAARHLKWRELKKELGPIIRGMNEKMFDFEV